MDRPFVEKRVSLYWVHDAETEPGRYSGERVLVEPLRTDAPPTADPYCCYVNTVIFYKDHVGGEELDRVEYRDYASVPSLLLVDGTWWKRAGGTVEHRDDAGWVFLHRLRSGKRLAAWMNEHPRTTEWHQPTEEGEVEA